MPLSEFAADVILNILSRRRQPASPAMILIPEVLRLGQEPGADVARRSG